MGGVSTVLNYGVFLLLLNVLSVNYLLATIVGFSAGAILGYYLNKTWTYDASDQGNSTAITYVSLYAASLLVGLCFFWVLVEKLSIPAEFGSILVIILTTIMNFLGTKFWVFSK